MKILVVFRVIVFTLLLDRIYGITPEKLFTSESKKVYYIENEYKYDWYESLSKCARMNMTLLTIDSKLKSEDINKLVTRSFGKNVILWVGGYAVGSHRQFTWVATGEEFTYTFWHGGNPDFHNGEEFCVQIGWSAGMQWNDNKCEKKFGFICEFKPQASEDDKNYKNQNIIINNIQKA